MMNGVKVREMTVKDVPEVVEIQESITKKKVPGGWARRMEAQVKSHDTAGFVAEKDNRLVGFIFGEIKGPAFGMEKSGWVVGIGVCPRYMGIGIGQTLAKEMMNFFEKEGVKEIYTTVRWHAVDMLSFFRSIGFIRSDFIDLRKHVE